MRPDSEAILQACDRLPACREHLDRADHFYEQNQYSNALQEYQAAYALQPYPLILFNIARLHHKQRQLAKAIDYYHRYLDTSDPQQTERARQLVSEAQEELSKDLASRPSHPAPEPAVAPVGFMPTGTTLSQSGDRHTGQPVYKRWWFWTAVGVVVAGGVAGVVAATYPRPAAVPTDAPAFHPFE